MPASTSAQDTSAPQRFIYTLPGVLLVIACYALLHTALRLGSSGNLGDDDPYDNLLVQVLAPGYDLNTGPLYDWLLWAVQHVAGTGLPGFLLLKYLMLVGMAGCLFLVTRRITGSAMWGFIAVESMVTVYQIFWRFHEGFTHRVAAMALVAATFWALIRLLDRGGWGNRFAFAALAGLGLLTEHAYAVFLLALLAACATQASVRRLVFDWRLLATLPVVALIVAPYAYWVLQQPGGFVFLEWGQAADHSLKAVARGLRDALLYPVLVLSPYILLVPAMFPRVWRFVLRSTHATARADAPDLMRLLSHLLVWELGFLLIKDGLLQPRSNYPVHSLLPLFILGIAWLTAKIQASEPTAKRVTAFILVMGFFTLFAFGMRSGNLYVNEPFCSRCRWGVPYPELAQQMRSHGFENGTIVTNEQFIAGNMRRFFPKSRVVLVGFEYALPPAPSRQQAVIWSVNEPGNTPAPKELEPYLPPQAAVESWTLPWHHLWRPTGYRQSTWNVVLDTQR